jgi:hypothetical protein
MKAMASSGTCIRLAVSTHLDGPMHRVTCYSGSFLECGNCAARNPIQRPIHGPRDVIASLSSFSVDEHEVCCLFYMPAFFVCF